MNTQKPLGNVNSYRDLVVWQKSRSLAIEAYRLCMTTPFERHRGLSDQIMRSAVSIPSNIAEGDERGTNKDALRFLLIARGSLAELETQLSIAEAIGIIPQPLVGQIAAQLDEVARLLGGTIKMRKAREEDGR
ncbi:MAG: four helix bundle protein [Verrucomicrobia bacterium]|nr:four helix bundle protein [Verrucomicrobiota bacterium]